MKAPTADDTLNELSKLAGQLAVTIDDRFDFSLTTEYRDERLLKLVMMINFLLERARENIDQLADAKRFLEEEVKERTGLLEMVIRASTSGIWFWYVHENRLEVSDRFAELSNKTPQSLSKFEDWLSLLHPEDVNNLSDAVRRHINGVTESLVCRYRIADGFNHYRWVVMNGSLERDQTGNPVLLAGTQTDITPLVAIDQESGMPNELAFDEWLNSQINQLASPLLVAIVSIDHLSELADSLDGAQLKGLGKQIRKRIHLSLPMSAFVAKLPGESFGVGLPDTRSLPHQILSELFDQFNTPFEVEGHGPLKLSLSIGTFMLPSLESENTVEACKSGLWSAVRKAREKGGNHFVQFNQQLREERSKNLKIEATVNNALRENRVIAFFQPIFSSGSYQIAGFEALVRIQSETGSFIPPDDFIPIVEESDLIIPLTESVLGQALDFVKMVVEQKLCPDGVSVAVNVAPLHLLSGELPDLVQNALKSRGLSPDVLKLEVTETALVNNMDVAVEQLNALRRIGCRVAIDDFGTGYSSLEYLHSLPVDILKLDRVFVQRITKSQKTAAIAKTVCDLAAILSLEVVSEGVEEQSEVDALTAMGPMLFQGYYFCKPLPSQALTNWLRERVHKGE